MKTVRTTVTLPKDVYEDLRAQAFHEKKSYGQVVAGWRKKTLTLMDGNPQYQKSKAILAKPLTGPAPSVKELLTFEKEMRKERS